MSTEHCLLTLLWSETDDDGDPLDSGKYEASEELKQKISEDWEKFHEQAETMGFNPDQHIAMALHPDNDGDTWNAVAHDFILTRNGHGAGFWDSDRWVAPWGDRLTELAQSFSEISCVVGDDGLIYC